MALLSYKLCFGWRACVEAILGRQGGRPLEMRACFNEVEAIAFTGGLLCANSIYQVLCELTLQLLTTLLLRLWPWDA